MLAKIIQKIKSAPKNPGIYIFYKGQIPLYIGKASNLKNRLQSYLKISDAKTQSLHEEADRLKIIRLHSNVEALIEESKLIKILRPKYNILWQDDKNYFYVAITKEIFPRISITHQPRFDKGMGHRAKGLENKKNLPPKPYPLNPRYIGPFTEGGAIKAVLRLLRRFFPYCAHSPHLRTCLDAQINKCFGYCCNKQTAATKQQISEYKKNILKIKNILTGKDKKFIHKLKDPYELLVLEKIWAHEPFLESRNQKIENRVVESKKALSSMPYDLRPKTIECYDNSHLSGKEAVGVMTHWGRDASSVMRQDEWLPERSLWRKFKIRGKYTEDDPRMIEEVLTRRFNHPEWPYPDLIIIDGGVTQFNAANRALRKRIKNNELGMEEKKSIIHNSKFLIPKIISFAKPNQLVYGIEKNPVPIDSLPENFQRLIKTAIQNTHNFAIRYHRQVRRRSITGLNYKI